MHSMHGIHVIHDSHLAHIQIYLFILLGFLVTSAVRPNYRTGLRIRLKSEIRIPKFRNLKSEFRKSENPICSKYYFK